VCCRCRATARPARQVDRRPPRELSRHASGARRIWDLEIAVDQNAKILGLRGRMVHDEARISRGDSRFRGSPPPPCPART
jgi:hypothetical protein